MVGFNCSFYYSDKVRDRMGDHQHVEDIVLTLGNMDEWESVEFWLIHTSETFSSLKSPPRITLAPPYLAGSSSSAASVWFVRSSTG